MPDDIAGRTYARVYRTTGRADLHAFLVGAVERSGGRVLYSSSPQRAPVYLGIHTQADERIGAFIYPFRATHRSIRNRPDDEHRRRSAHPGGVQELLTRRYADGDIKAEVQSVQVVPAELAPDMPRRRSRGSRERYSQCLMARLIMAG